MGAHFGREYIAWVQIPTVSHTINTTIYLYWGNPLIVTSQENITGTWDSNYKGVWHMPTVIGGASSVLDSTSNAANATPVNSPTNITGQIDGGGNFAIASSQYLSGPNVNLSGSALTISGWVNATTFQSGSPFISSLFGEEDSPTTGTAFIRFGDGGLAKEKSQFVILVSGSQIKLDGSITHSTGTWYYLTATYDGSNMRLYDNGVQDTSKGQSGSVTANIGFNFAAANIGGFARFLNGSLDEIRASTVVRSPDWILTEYNNQNSPSTFYTLGSEINSTNNFLLLLNAG